MTKKTPYVVPEAELLAPILRSAILDASIELNPLTREDETDF